MALERLATVPVLAVVLLLLVSFLIWKWLQRPDYSRLPKSPPTLPIIGNLHMLLKGKSFCGVIENISKEYGDVFTLWFGNQPIVMVGVHDLVHDLFVNQSLLTSSRSANSTVYSIATLGYKGIAFQSQRKQHQINRKVGSAALRDLFSNKSANCTKMLDAECTRLLRHFVDAAENDRAVDPAKLIYETTARIISGTCFGRPFIEKQENIDKVKKMVLLAFKTLDLSTLFVVNTFPWLRYVPLFGWNSVRLFSHARDDLIRQQFKEHLATFDSDSPPRDVTDVLLSSSPDDICPEERVMIITDLLDGGSETVGATLSWAILCLLRHPEWQVNLRTEIEGVVETTEELSTVNMKALPLLSAFYSEVQRWSNAVFSSLIHVTTTDVSIGDYMIPRGTGLFALFNLMHMNEKHWDEPAKFNPMRFIDGKGGYAIPNKSFMPFSLGPRSCPGDNLAKREMFFILLYLIYHLTFLPEKDGEPPSFTSYEEGTVKPLPFKVRVNLTRPLSCNAL